MRPKQRAIILGWIAALLLPLAMIMPQDAAADTFQIGTGTEMSEVLPILNWWLDSYQGNEVIYLKEDLKMHPGDKITALSYHCVKGSAQGGNFNVRIKNTTLSQTHQGTEDPEDPSILLVNYEDTVNGNVQLGRYQKGHWITFELSEPFVYEGENIVIDIRNTVPSTAAGWCYFAATQCTPYRSLAWRNAKDESVSAFVPGYDPYGNYDSGFYITENSEYGDYPNVRITYTSTSEQVSAVSLDKSEMTLTCGESEQLVATIRPSSALNKTLSWTSSNPEVAHADSTGLVTALSEGYCTITATTTDGTDQSASCLVTVTPVEVVVGDIDGDGYVTVIDLNIVINHILGFQYLSDEDNDVNHDGSVDIGDVSTVITAIIETYEAENQNSFLY